MGVQRVLPLAFGALAVASETALVTIDIIFAFALSSASSPAGTRNAAIVASGLGSILVVLLLLLLGWQIWYRNGSHIQDGGHGRQHANLLARVAGVFGVLSAVASALVLGMMSRTASNLPRTILSSSRNSIVAGAFVVWAVAFLSQAVSLICMVLIQRRDFQRQIQPYQPDGALKPQSEMQETQPRAMSVQGNDYCGNASTESKTPPSSSGRSRAGSDTMNSLRSSVSQVVRPMTSKKSLHRPSSLDSRTRVTSISIEDGFDSWDTSTVDIQSWHAVDSASPTPPRFLETIPASPTTSRSPSPGCPLDLKPAKLRRRSRSFSPANSFPNLTKGLPTTLTENINEAHIHPLFRSDSPSPPPPTTWGTIVTAAPGAGQVISDRASIRSIHRIRSGSLPSRPLMPQDSLDSIRKDIEREEQEQQQELVGERTLTPPIPEWILSGTPPRNSPSVCLREQAAGLGKARER